ncbi:MAG: TIGR01777 family oxidoreductase [Mycobacteriales bacterium]
MQIAVTGSSGMIGSALVPALRAAGHRVVRVVRRPPQGTDEIRWDPVRRELDPAALADVDAVVHLAGVNVGSRRWTQQRKDAIVRSRVDGTETVAEALARAAGSAPRPRTLLSASAVGWYGDTGDREIDETAPSGAGFLATVCRRWEACTAAAGDAGVRVVHLRSGLVCSPNGGLLGPLLPLAKAGLAGPLGSGRQWWSWISLADEVGAVLHLLGRDDVTGPVNLTGPAPVTNRDFTRVLGSVLHRPAVLRVPGFVLRLTVGDFAPEGITAGQKVLPRVLERTGYRFQHRTAEQALRWVTGRER